MFCEVEEVCRKLDAKIRHFSTKLENNCAVYFRMIKAQDRQEKEAA